ncbi:hypothetical protein CO057_01575 [Candidatus Uhrbacteria bacterium CG_4_9_14_0_2_um_filter_41_50]|uniref:Transcription regulator TrmB N-terminal domain-containing protein n=1 Tax=Candidatus Uhrbacteria bacterium CG_4_9_14_0_2_um_filter_41_50 TaxID=1975031 RepID=A0A2M8EPK6_9BACT|nr:MAG: hypothetical protein COZ45_00085 [Candidatus Uhrbacteria bacterium CG_4_10_14_3_um_filter_41_21]PIZ54843.1 MAG: hypothetical protein COY24_02415 [Candidatus Uhrbacteria bacterium CG_4_10_14_0_2_um_filter_41_21]PJB84333.1 MAG: hypothetical protein CO086_04165 [Candidatus Uhrbacteria bacterium CG_4_9_14_0_8_um_filter_41_16]PJC24679.1 MAG: hypothetical protein CO057_01575 [Candidatus Uhrbacteria bacterium CG_4_9_14_0_2_um_filter_41_50]PJE75068.1 MAG: hypothetical protein COV03_02100 [Candi
MDKIKEILTGLGLSTTEARLYLAMLKLGPASVQNIAKESELSRTATYDLIAGLQKKGLASTYDRDKKTFFSAENPDQLETYFSDKMRGMDSSFERLKKVIPEMRAISKHDRPRVRFYTGEEGMRAMFRDVQDSGAEEFLEVVNVDAVYKNIKERVLLDLRTTEKFHMLRFKTLVQGEPRNPMSGGTIRLIDEKDFGLFEGDILLYSDRVVFLSFALESEVVILENKTLADTMRVLFNVAWQSARPYSRI